MECNVATAFLPELFPGLFAGNCFSGSLGNPYLAAVVKVTSLTRDIFAQQHTYLNIATKVVALQQPRLLRHHLADLAGEHIVAGTIVYLCLHLPERRTVGQPGLGKAVLPQER